MSDCKCEGCGNTGAMLTLLCNDCRERMKQKTKPEPAPQPEIKPEGKDVRRRKK